MEKYGIEEIRGKTLGIVGYGDIGRAAARLAKAYGMNIIALRRKPPKEGNVKDDPLCDQVYFGTGDDAEDRKEALYRVMRESDYVLYAAPLVTPEIENISGKEAFSSNAKKNCLCVYQ